MSCGFKFMDIRYSRIANSARRFQQEFPVNIASEKELGGRFRGQIAFETMAKATISAP
jgi:hypothetical protein